MKGVLALLAALHAATAMAQEHAVAIHVDAAWSRALPPVSTNGAAYLTLRNAGAGPDVLVGVETPAAARVEMHEHAMEGGLARMRRLEALELPAGESVRMRPGGLHLMLLGLRQPLRRGERFSVTLHFRDAGSMQARVEIMASGDEPPGGPSGQSGSHHGRGSSTR